MTNTNDNRVDLYTSIHKGIRSKLFEVARSAAQLDADDLAACDRLHASVEELLGFLEEHAEHEDRHILPALRTVAPEVETSLAHEHRLLDELQTAVALAADALTRAAAAGRQRRASDLARAVNRLTASHVAHMHREETEANAALWSSLSDHELAAIRLRITTSVEPERMAAWMQFVLPALSPNERALMGGGAG